MPVPSADGLGLLMTLAVEGWDGTRRRGAGARWLTIIFALVSLCWLALAVVGLTLVGPARDLPLWLTAAVAGVSAGGVILGLLWWRVAPPPLTAIHPSWVITLGQTALGLALSAAALAAGVWCGAVTGAPVVAGAVAVAGTLIAMVWCSWMWLRTESAARRLADAAGGLAVWARDAMTADAHAHGALVEALQETEVLTRRGVSLGSATWTDSGLEAMLLAMTARLVKDRMVVVPEGSEAARLAQALTELPDPQLIAEIEAFAYDLRWIALGRRGARLRPRFGGA